MKKFVPPGRFEIGQPPLPADLKRTPPYWWVEAWYARQTAIQGRLLTSLQAAGRELGAWELVCRVGSYEVPEVEIALSALASAGRVRVRIDLVGDMLYSAAPSVAEEV